MITDIENSLLEELQSSTENGIDFYDAKLVIVLSRYHRINKEAVENSLWLGPSDFSAIVKEATEDLNKWFEGDNT